MKKIGKKEIILLVVAIIVFLSALGFFCYREIPELLKPKVYYRTYTKEKGWSKWSKNGETSGNEYNIKAIQIKLKNSKNSDVIYKTFCGHKWDDKDSKSNDIACDKKSSIKQLRINLTGDLYKNYIIKYRVSSDGEWSYWSDNFVPIWAPQNKEKKYELKKVEITINKR